jgi:DNA-binding CsgD family transcriptional regulator
VSRSKHTLTFCWWRIERCGCGTGGAIKHFGTGAHGPKSASGQDTVKISARAQEVEQPTSAQVRLLHAEGQSVVQIASKLDITPHAVQSHLGTPAQAPTKSK